MPVSFTQKGYYEVWRDGEKISQHNREREATETITEHSAIHGDGDYEIRAPIVMARAYGVIANQTGGGDTTPPTTPGSVSAVATSATTGTVTWTASTDNVGVAGYQVFVDGSPIDTTTNLTYPLTGLSPSTQYSVTVTAYDAAGNNSTAGGPSLFTTDANSAPVWSLGDQSYTVGDAVSISLDGNCTDADGDTITYSLVSGTLPSGLALSGTRNETLSGTVDTAETAVFTLGASDGTASVQNVALTFTISAADTTAPSAPTNLSVVDASTSAALSWTDNSESDLSHYNVYRSATSASGPWGQRNASPVTVSSFNDTGLSVGTEYWYYVTAVDTSSNESSASNITSRFGAELTGIFVDQVSGSDSYDGTLPVYPGTGTSGPKATVSAGIAACSVGDSLYLTNTQSYNFATYDLDWNSGATSAQAAELAGCYISGNSAFKWTSGSGQSRPVVNFRMRSTNDYFTIHGLTTATQSFTLEATSVWNFTLSYIASTKTTDTTAAGVFYFDGGVGQRGINIRNCTFTWADGLNWALGSDYVKIDTGYRYGEIAYNTFTRAHHDCLGLLGSSFWVHHNTFDNTSVAGTTGYRACSFNVERDLPDSTPPDTADGGEPYGENLIENNTFISATTPGVENTAPIIKMQNKKTIYRLNTFDAFCSTTNADVFQIQTCCSDPFASHLAPLVAEQRFYNNSITASGFQRWSRLRTWQTDGSAGNAENTRTENHDNWIFNNHFAGDPLSSAEALWEFQQIAPAYRVGNVISQNKIEYNSYSNSRTSAFIEDATNGQQTLATAESNFPGFINNNTVGSSGGAGLGRDIAVTVGSGTSTTLPVSDAGSFMARINDTSSVGEVYAGDTITVNGQTARVLTRDLVNNTLGLNTSVTWTAGLPVNLSGYATKYTGVAPSESSEGFTEVSTAVDATGTGTRYDIGGGNNYGTELSDVPWQSLGPGDAVNIYYRASPYKSLVLVSEQGTAANRIIINGVTDSSGNRPIIDGDGATVVNPGNWDSDFFGTLMMLHRDTVGGTFGQPAEYVTIQNLEFRNATSAYQYDAGSGLTAYDPAARAIWSHGAQYINIYGCIFRNSGCGVFVQAPAERNSKTFHIKGCLFDGNGNGDRDHQIYLQAINDPGVNKNIVEGCVFDDPRTGVTSVAQLKIRGTGTVVRYNWFTSAQRTIDLVEGQDEIPNYMYDNWTAQQIIDEYDTSYIYGNAFVIDADYSGVLGQLLHVGMDTLEDGDGGLFQNVGSAFGQDAQRGTNGGATYFFHNTVYINNYYPGGSYRSQLFDLDSNNESTGTYSAGKLVSINNVFEFDGGATSRYSHGDRTGDINWDGANIVNYSEIHNGLLYESDAYANAENTGDDPNITITVNGNIISGTASLVDPTNATLLNKNLSLGSGSSAIGQAAALPSALSSYSVTKSPASPLLGGFVTRVSADDLGAYESSLSTIYDNFNGSTQSLKSSKWTAYNNPGSGSIVVQQSSGRYEATIPSGDASATTWFNADEGRLDYVTLTGDFDFIARNIGLNSGATNNEYQFCGVAVWSSATNYEFAVAGQRGPTANTIEYKITSSGSSTQNDIGANALPTGKADIRVVRSGSDVDFYYQQPGTSPDSWTLLPHDTLGAARINFGTGAVRVGLVTYGFLFVAQFVGTCDQVEIT